MLDDHCHCSHPYELHDLDAQLAEERAEVGKWHERYVTLKAEREQRQKAQIDSIEEVEAQDRIANLVAEIERERERADIREAQRDEAVAWGAAIERAAKDVLTHSVHVDIYNVELEHVLADPPAAVAAVMERLAEHEKCRAWVEVAFWHGEPLTYAQLMERLRQGERDARLLLATSDLARSALLTMGDIM